MNRYQLLITGQLSASTESFSVVNPASGDIFAHAPECREQQLNEAVEAAQHAFPQWRQAHDRRKSALLEMANAIQQNSEKIAEVLTLEQGKPLKHATREVMASALQIQFAANIELPVEVLQDTDDGRIELHHKPYGVVAAITPWNFPVSIAMGKVATALIAGNTVVLKPSPYTPLSTLLVGEAIQSVLPPGVLNIISGADPLGATLTAHPLVRKIDFTGSVNTGKRVARAASDDLKRVTLELGGNDAAIVLDDVQPKEIANKLFWGAFTNSGQVCIAIKRAYVHEAIYAQLVSELSQLAEKYAVGDGMDDKTALGPINNLAQFERVSSLVDDAKQHGARIETGGAPTGQGYGYHSTIITEAGDEMPIVAEEQFGPVLPILPYTDIDDAIERANRTHFGLGGSVWSADLDRATEVARQMQCGTAWVNQHLALSPIAPFGGSKWSGIGYINGRWGYEGATELQVVNIKR